MDLLQRVFCGACGIASIFYFIVKYSLSHWKKRGILHEKPKFFWGNIKGVGKRRHISQALKSIYEKYKETDAPYVGFYAFIKPMVMIIKLDLIQEILGTDFEYFSERGLYYNANADPLTYNVLQLDGEEWQEWRSKLETAFEDEKLQTIFSKLMLSTDIFRGSLQEKAKHQTNFNISALVDSYNIDVIAMLAFGVTDSNTLMGHETEFRNMCKNYHRNRSLLKEYLAMSFPNLARLLNYRSFDELATKYFVNMVQDTLDERIWTKRRQNDFLQLFSSKIPVIDRAARLIEFQKVAAQSFSFVLIGLEAANSSLAFCLYELALQPELQEKVRNEIKSVLASYDGVLTDSCLKEMKYLDQVLCETWRLHPPYAFLLRQTTKDYEINDSIFMLREGNSIIIPVSAIHHDPLIYPNPAHFNPDRFQPDEIKKRHPMSWLPFGFGPRNCVAMRYAKMQALVGLVTLLRDYKFSPSEETEIPCIYNNKTLLLTTRSDVYLLLERA